MCNLCLKVYALYTVRPTKKNVSTGYISSVVSCCNPDNSLMNQSPVGIMTINSIAIITMNQSIQAPRVDEVIGMQLETATQEWIRRW